MHPLARALHARIADPVRVDAYYAPLAVACAARLERATRRPWTVGIQGPQGGGKSTLAEALVGAFNDVDVRAISVSIDDFYLTYAEQTAIAERHADNPYLRYRGYPGTHDVPLGRAVIDALRALTDGKETLVPAYDKSAHEGRGDRADPSRWRRVIGPLDVLVLEGWMLGFSPVPEDRLDALEAGLRAPNAYLAAYSAWNETLDTLVHLDVESLDTIVKWRVDSERARRSRGEIALSDDDARDYIKRCLPAYRAYVPRLQASPPCADFERIVLADDRLPRDRPR